MLYLLSFAAMAVSIASVAWTGEEVALPALLTILAGLGHLVSASGKGRRLRLGLLIYPTVFLLAWVMRDGLIAVVTTGSLYRLTGFLIVLQALASFNLRSIRTLYDTLLLSLVVLLLASEGALSIQFGLFLLTFGVIAVAFLISAHVEGLAGGVRRVVATGNLQLAGSATVLLVLVLSISFVVFLALPQGARVHSAQPLPSRLDPTLPPPPPPLEVSGEDAALSKGVLPSREETFNDDPPSADVPLTPGEETSSDGQSSEASPDSQTGSGTMLDGTAGASLTTSRYTDLGYVGDQGRDVVMYVRSPFASYWRGQVMDEYDGTGWTPSTSEPQLVSDGGRLRFPDMPSWTSLTNSYVQTYFLKVEQPSALFTAYSPGLIALRSSPDGSDPGRTAQSSVEQLRQATEYRVVSAVPRLTPELLRSDSADRAYLRNVQSGAIPRRVRDLASALVAGATSDYEKAARIERYLLDNYQYDLRASAAPSSGEALESFLFERQAGYCAQFATAMAVMARAVDLPARVAIGYLPGKYDSITGVHTVRLQDGHAWVEVKFNTFGWVPFDPTPRPDSPWAVDSGFTKATKSLQQVLRAEDRDLMPDAPLGGAADLFSQQRAPGVALLASLASILLVALTVIRVARKHQNRGHDPLHQYATLPGNGRNEVRRVYRKALRLLKRKGYPQRQAHQSPEDYLAVLRELGIRIPDAFQTISSHTAEVLYDPRPFGHPTAREAFERLKELRSALALIRKPARRSPAQEPVELSGSRLD